MDPLTCIFSALSVLGTTLIIIKITFNSIKRYPSSPPPSPPESVAESLLGAPASACKGPSVESYFKATTNHSYDDEELDESFVSSTSSSTSTAPPKDHTNNKKPLSPILTIVLAISICDLLSGIRTISAQVFPAFVAQNQAFCNVQGFTAQVFGLGSISYSFLICLILFSSVYTDSHFFLRRKNLTISHFFIICGCLLLSIIPLIKDKYRPQENIGCWVVREEGWNGIDYRYTFFMPLLVFVTFAMFLLACLVFRPKKSLTLANSPNRKILVRMGCFVAIFLSRWMTYILASTVLYDWLGDEVGGIIITVCICSGGFFTFLVFTNHWGGRCSGCSSSHMNRSMGHSNGNSNNMGHSSNNTSENSFKNEFGEGKGQGQGRKTKKEEKEQEDELESSSPTSVLDVPETRHFFNLPQTPTITTPNQQRTAAIPKSSQRTISSDSENCIYKSSEIWAREQKREEILEKAKENEYSLLSDDAGWDRV